MLRSIFVAAVILVGVGVVQVGALIPAVCANNASLQAHECCPTTPSGVCGGSRGSCVNVSTLCKTDYSSPMLSSSNNPNMYFTNDGRFNWPSQIFDRVCQCHGNYGGYDCLDCKFGYGGNDCNTKLPNRIRTSIATLSDWSTYRNQLSKAKHEPYSRYKVYIGGNLGLRNEASYVNVSLYDTFAWIHHYVSRTQLKEYYRNESALDYAHESVGFLTWHRLYLLWFEREMQYVLDGTPFTLHYWDWTMEADRNAPFGFNKLGISSLADGTVTGELMNNWYIVCTTDKSVCNPTNYNETSRVTRFVDTSQDWPNSESAKKCLMIDQFRKDTTIDRIANKYDSASFSNYLEGFTLDDLCGNGNELCNANYIPSGDFTRTLHNKVHMLLDGTMGEVPIASNDPVFINHHTMIDCIFEQWLRNHPLPNRVYPAQLQPEFAGHAAGDCIVPFIPVYNHSYFFNRISDDFGYNCDLRSLLTDDPTGTPPATTGTTSTNTRPTGSTSTNTRPTAGQPTSPNSTATTAESAILLFSLIVVCLCVIIL